MEVVREEGDKRLVRERRDTVQPYKRIRGGDPPHRIRGRFNFICMEY